MGKISPVVAKYIIHVIISIEGSVDKPDVIGAIFGQTEGLLGAELEMRELQKEGKIGRIEVNLETVDGRSVGEIQVPTALDKSETTIIAAALETIDRIGPTEASIQVTKIEDVRGSKRDFIIGRAKKLLEGLDKIDWVERTKEGQRNWIGRSEGLQGFFDVDGTGEKLEIFTTRPDTIFGVTFMVLAPEHPLVDQITINSQKNKVRDYQKQSARKTALDRQTSQEKTGVFTGAFALNPVNNEKIPVWISDYVLMDYGTGAIMAVPGHDERDFEFAKKFDLKIIKVLDGNEMP